MSEKLTPPCRAKKLFFLSVISLTSTCLAQQGHSIAGSISNVSAQQANGVSDSFGNNGVAGVNASAQMVDLTLKQAVRLALKESPVELIAKLDIEDRRKQVRNARAALLPQAASVNTAYLNRYNLQEFLGPFQVHVTGNEVPIRIGPYQVLQAGGEFSQQVLNLPEIRRLQARKEDVRTSQKQLTSTREQIVAAVVNSYQAVLKAVATETAAVSRQRLAQRLLDQASQQLKSGTGTGIEVLRAKVELANEQQRVSDAQAAHREAIYGLTNLLDLQNGQEARPTELLEFSNLPLYDTETQINFALANRPEVASLRSQQRAAHLETQATRAERWPVLAFNGSFAEQGRTFDNMIPAYNYAGTIKFPILDGGRIAAETARSKVAEERLAAELDRTQSDIRSQVKTALSQLEAARYAVQVSGLGVDLAEQEVAQASRRSAAGVASSVEVTTAQDQLARANDNQIDALFRFNQARAALARATGNAENVYAQ